MISDFVLDIHNTPAGLQQLQAFKKEQEAKQEAEMAVFLAKLKKEHEAAKQADPKLFTQSYVDQKLKEQGDQHAKRIQEMKEEHAREIQEMKDRHVGFAGDVIKLKAAHVRLLKDMKLIAEVATSGAGSRLPQPSGDDSGQVLVLGPAGLATAVEEQIGDKPQKVNPPKKKWSKENRYGWTSMTNL
eukprot:SAG22_NODE_250_length_13779_cov_6.413450_1_plen_186_part_00